MLAIISPAKSLNFSPTSCKLYTQPRFAAETNAIVSCLKKFSSAEISKLMSISPKLAELNAERFKNYPTTLNLDNAKQAILAYDGDVYNGMDRANYKQDDLGFAQNHLRIISGFYGLLKPLDLIAPYRLEMSTDLAVNGKRNLYELWQGKITEQLIIDLKESPGENIIINLASQEYSKAINHKKINIEVIDINFQQWHKGAYKTIALLAKRARGEMADFIIKHRVTELQHLKQFNYSGYCLAENLSSSTQLVFRNSP